MKICKLDLASQIYGAGAWSYGWTPLAPSVQLPLQPAVSSQYPGGGSGGHTSIDSGSGSNASIGGFIGSIFGTDSGVTDGKRDDGHQLGYGCGDSKTDAMVPDRVFGYDLTQACVNHDTNFSTCGVTKEAADKQLGQDVSAAMGGGVLGAVVGGAYELGVTFFGGTAYETAQTQAGCRSGNSGGYSGAGIGGNVSSGSSGSSHFG